LTISRALLENKHHRVPPDYYDTGIQTNVFQRYWHTRRFDVVCEMIGSINGRLLDIGCHGGTFTSQIIQRTGPTEVVGIDIIRESVKYAAIQLPGAQFVCANGLALPFQDAHFDVITCLEALEHVESPGQVLLESRRCLRGNGDLLVLVPSENWLFRFIWYFWTKFKGRVWDGVHIQQFKHQTLDILLEETGFQIVQRRAFLLGMLIAIKARKPSSSSPQRTGEC